MSFNQLLKESKDESLSGVKWHVLKQSIVKSLLTQGDSTIADLSTNIQSSIPTVTKAVNELIADRIVEDIGKVSNSGGRRPSLYGIVASSGYVLGVEIGRTFISLGLQDLKSQFVYMDLKVPFVLEDNFKSLDALALKIRSFIARSNVDKNKVWAACASVPGRVNSVDGTGSKSFFNEEKSFSDELSARIGLPVFLENDTRAMTWGEYAQGGIDAKGNIIYLNYDWGVSIGIIIKGELFYGKSGYAGEFGHSPIFNNKILCYCGKEGCLESEISGWSLVNQFNDEIGKGRQSLVDISNSMQPYREIIEGAMSQEDSLCLDLITAQCDKMGRYLSMLINLLNPDTLIIGGEFSRLKDFVLLPIQASIRKHSVSIVNKDVIVKLSEAGDKAGILGVCYVVKSKLLAALG